MVQQVAIVHGWSDNSTSFHGLRAFLNGNGFEVTGIWLGDYISMDDDVRISDVAKRMNAVISGGIASGELRPPFDLIVHSTGGLVAREWLARYYPNGENCPVKRLLMLAPANFGSRLAAAGKSLVGRVLYGWDKWFQTGAEILRGLELASPYQWDLACRDLLDPAGAGTGPYGGDKVWPFVIIGSRGYSSGLRRAVNEDGSDGTVRACAANLNCIGLTIDFTGGMNPEVTPWHPRNGDAVFPFAVLPDRDHSTIVRPSDQTDAPNSSPALGRRILQALRCASPAEYRQIGKDWAVDTEDMAALGGPDGEAQRSMTFVGNAPPASAFHQYLQAIVAVADDQGLPIDDYFLEFFAPEDQDDTEAVYFQREVLEHTHVNTSRRDMRCLFIDRSDLMTGYYPRVEAGRERVVAMSISAAPAGNNVRHFDSSEAGAPGHLIVHREDDEERETIGAARLRRNMTHLVRIVVPRVPQAKVFTLTQ